MPAIFFDFGNVIGFFDHRRAVRQLARFGRLPPEELHAALFGGQLEDAYESGRLSSAEFLCVLRDRCRLGGTDAELTAAYVDMFWPNPDVCALIPLLKPRHRLYLASNTTELHSAHFRRQFADVLGHLDGLALSFEAGVRKPKPGFFEHCRRLAGRAPAECVFIDDLPANVAGAVACGWKGIVYRSGADLRAELARAGVLI
jgi:FMN phosphatase YigB (HAD superfamily)